MGNREYEDKLHWGMVKELDHIDIIVILYTGIYSYKNIPVFCSGIDLLVKKI